MARSRKTTSDKGKKDSSQSTLKTAFPASTSSEAADQVPPIDKEPEVKSPSAAAPADGNLNHPAAHSTAALRLTIQHSRYVNIEKGLNYRKVSENATDKGGIRDSLSRLHRVEDSASSWWE